MSGNRRIEMGVILSTISLNYKLMTCVFHILAIYSSVWFRILNSQEWYVPPGDTTMVPLK